MNKTRVSKAYRGKDHIGWKKTVAGRSWFLCYGVSPSDEALAIRIATALEAKWQLIKLSGGTELTEADLHEAKELVSGHPLRSQAPVVLCEVRDLHRPSAFVGQKLTSAGCPP